MKRTSYDSEYDKVRRAATPKPAPAPAKPAPEPRRASPREEERSRVQGISDEIRARLSEQQAEERERQRLADKKNADLARAFNEREIMAEYERRRLEPPVGTLVSLETLLFTGWRIGEDNGRPVLVPPLKPDATRRRRRREDYEQST
jgi:hypothetical protein